MSDDRPKRRKRLFPQTLGECVQQVTTPVFKSRGIAEMRILRDWHSIIGPELSPSCIPVKITFPPNSTRDGTLVISAGDGTCAMQLQYMTPQILERLTTYFGYKAITRISITQSVKVDS